MAAGAFDTGFTIFSMWKIGYDTRVFSVTDLSAKSMAPFLSTVTFSSRALRRMAFQMSGSVSFERVITLAEEPPSKLKTPALAQPCSSAPMSRSLGAVERDG